MARSITQRFKRGGVSSYVEPRNFVNRTPTQRERRLFELSQNPALQKPREFATGEATPLYGSQDPIFTALTLGSNLLRNSMLKAGAEDLSLYNKVKEFTPHPNVLPSRMTPVSKVQEAAKRIPETTQNQIWGDLKQNLNDSKWYPGKINTVSIKKTTADMKPFLDEFMKNAPKERRGGKIKRRYHGIDAGFHTNDLNLHTGPNDSGFTGVGGAPIMFKEGGFIPKMNLGGNFQGISGGNSGGTGAGLGMIGNMIPDNQYKDQYPVTNAEFQSGNQTRAMVNQGADALGTAVPLVGAFKQIGQKSANMIAPQDANGVRKGSQFAIGAANVIDPLTKDTQSFEYFKKGQIGKGFLNSIPFVNTGNTDAQKEEDKLKQEQLGYGNQPQQQFSQGGETGNTRIEVEGLGRSEGTAYQMGKGELLVDPKGKIIKNFIAGERHKNGGLVTTEQTGLTIIPLNRSQEFINRDMGTRRQIIKSLSSEQDFRQNKALKTLQEEGLLPDDIYASGGKIRIKPSHRGRFTEYKARTGKSTSEALHSSDPHVRQMANFARNAAKWKHENGGLVKFDLGGVNQGPLQENIDPQGTRWGQHSYLDQINNNPYGLDNYSNYNFDPFSTQKGPLDTFDQRSSSNGALMRPQRPLNYRDLQPDNYGPQDWYSKTPGKQNSKLKSTTFDIAGLAAPIYNTVSGIFDKPEQLNPSDYQVNKRIPYRDLTNQQVQREITSAERSGAANIRDHGQGYLPGRITLSSRIADSRAKAYEDIHNTNSQARNQVDQANIGYDFQNRRNNLEVNQINKQSRAAKENRFQQGLGQISDYFQGTKRDQQGVDWLEKMYPGLTKMRRKGGRT